MSAPPAAERRVDPQAAREARIRRLVRAVLAALRERQELPGDRW